MGEVTAQRAMLRHFVAQAFSYDKPDHLAVAVSGGGDSIALLHLLAEWAAEERVRLQAVTVDHGLRPEAAEEARFAAEVAQGLKVKHTTLAWGGWRGEGNLQDAARRARYRLMADWAKGQGIGTIALAHTADDQAETFFMRLSRASGIDGLTGMQRRRMADGIAWVRPLLMQERAELRAYLREMRQPWIDDPSNEDEAFDRVKARRAMAALAPLGIDAHVVGRVMDHLSQVRSALDFATHDHALSCVREDRGDLIIGRRAFSEAAPEVNRRLIAHALRWIASADYGPRGMKLQEFLSAMLRGRDATLHGVRLLGGKESFRLTREHAAVAGTRGVPGALWDGRWRIEGVEGEGLIVRALGQDGLLQIGELPADAPPRETLSASPAVFAGNTLVAAPLVGFGPATARLQNGRGDFFTTLLSH
ncbi:tRNA lysidine(34) synthetase TilS [Celeribacter indicus]|uniref:tRNA(Ile)-lysidine synthase n=1 Tax=Celeribacter indicus TaxID=1208324 RepID=A0A0B5DQV6_9RHOB|nr:tRNA lysidine(34) synthetase TilS [Celeribacter indicus]AJE45913.1 tRNA(Ile)-lysidine synthetase [Celeribacter indicus]SDW63586.1 tRNA(Ile)-lysidine synthase [Celeribacter indicus]